MARLRLLGGFALSDGAGRPLAVATRKDRLLLACLAIHALQPQPREKLAALLWGDRAEEQARASLRQSLAALRDVFRPLGCDPLLTTRDSVALDSALVESDAATFIAASSAGVSPGEVARLYSGPLLAGVEAPNPASAEWLSAERQRFEELAVGAIARIAQSEASPGDRDVALGVARQLLSADPLREALWRAVMRLHLASGNRAEAMSAYACCKATLTRDLAVAPSLETEQLYRDIVAGPAAPPPREAGAHVSMSGRERPCLAALPFTNLSGDAALSPLCDGLAEEITTGVGHFRLIDVIDCHSSAAIARLPIDVREIGARLGATLIVQGSLQRTGRGMRITVRLVDAASRRQLWGEGFDCATEELLSVPDRVSRGIVTTLHNRLESSLLEQGRRKPQLSAYECLLLGVRHLRSYGHENNVKAVEYFDKATALDPGYALAKAYRAFADVVLYNYDSAPREVLENARRKGEEAVEMDADDARCHWLLGMTCAYLGDFETDLREHVKALALNPYDADVLASYATTLAGIGQPEEGLAKMRDAMRLNPYHTEWYWMDLGSILYLAGRYEEAAAAYRHKPDPGPWALARLAACYGQLGRTEDSRATVAALFRNDPGFRLSQHRTSSWGPGDSQLFIEGMRKAGLPE